MLARSLARSTRLHPLMHVRGNAGYGIKISFLCLAVHAVATLSLLLNGHSIPWIWDLLTVFSIVAVHITWRQLTVMRSCRSGTAY